ncbi:MAG: hypothetical protein NC818_02515 [Candidatus Omnitrophica bacterium]|nr:hypothetical protein [Candidatus Omnitrophota bacterium]
MRSRIQRKKNIFLIFFLLIIGLSLFIYAERGQLLNEIKASIEKELSRQLSVSLKIGDFKHWWARNLNFGDVQITDSKDSFFISAKDVYFNFSLWDIFLRRKSESKDIGFFVKDAAFFVKGIKIPLRIISLSAVLSSGYLEIKESKGILAEFFPFELKAILGSFAQRNPKIDLKCHFERDPSSRFLSSFIPTFIYMSGDSEKILIEGFNDLEKPVFHLSGEFLPLVGRFSLIFEKYQDNKNFPLRIEGDFKEKKKSIKIIFNHFPLMDNNELISNIFIEGEYDSQEKILEGKVYSSGTLFNFLPLPEFEGSYRLKDGMLNIDSFKWADSLWLEGDIRFLDFVSGNLRVLLRNLNLLYFAYFYYPNWNAWGGISGGIDLQIREGNVFTKGSFDFTEGEFGPFKFKGGKIKFEGENSVFRLTDTRIYQEKGYFDLGGEIDLKKLGKYDFVRNIVLIPYQEGMEWQGWRVSQKDYTDSIIADKGIDEKFSIQFRSYMKDNQGITKEKSDEFGLEYKLKEDRSLKLRLKENEEIFGFERKVRF